MSNENTTYINYLIEISKAGRQRGYLDLCEIVLPNIYTVVYRLINEENLARKVTIQTFMYGWNKIKDFDVSWSFIVWIKSVAIQYSMDELAKNSSLLNKLPQETATDRISLDKLIVNLPLVNRVIFVLHDLEGYAYKEILQFFPELIEDELKTILIQTRQYLIGSLFK